MIKFHEGLRYAYPLTPDSVVLDIGGYEGNFAYEIARKYGCHVIVFEPVKEFYEKCLNRLYSFRKVTVNNFALGRESKRVAFKVNGDMSGEFNIQNGSREQVVEFREFKEAMYSCPCVIGANGIDLLKINIEGGEYDLMELIFELGIISKIKNLQIQPHTVVPDCEARWKSICDRLKETHELVYAEPWIWFGWRRIEP